MTLKEVHEHFGYQRQFRGSYDEDTYITGRFDLLAVNKARVDPIFWILVVEAKNSEAEAMTGLPQLLTYAYSSLQRQNSVWGLTTNGICYRFVHIQGGNLPAYQLMPTLNLLQAEPPVQLIQVLKAIHQL